MIAVHRVLSAGLWCRQRALVSLLGGSLWLMFFSGVTWADIETDGTTGPATALIGPHYEISEDLGQAAGGNLFHSFLRFNLREGESATFTGSSAIENIISRVTGGPSDINGLISSSIPGVNLFLINPHGMVFGERASLNIGGAVHVSTAHELRFDDGQVWSATPQPGASSSFTVASPVAFGFISGEKVASIRINQSRLRVRTEETLAIVGGDLTIAGGSLQAPGGTLALSSVASDGEVPVGGAVQDMTLDTFDELGTIDLSNSADLSTSGNGGGTVVIRGGQLRVDQAFIRTDNTGSTDNFDTAIDIEVGEEMSLDNGAFIRAGALGSGRSGDIRIQAKNVTISDNASISSLNVRRGESGDILVQADETVSIIDQDGDALQTGILSFGGGANESNEVRVVASWLDMSGGVVGTATGLVQGRAGNVTVEVNHLRMKDGALIDSQSSQGVEGSTIQIAAETVILSRGSRIITDASDAPGGDIEIDAEIVRLQDSEITATAQGDEQAPGGNITMSKDIGVTVLERSEIKAEAEGGNGGVIRIRGFLVSDGQSRISADSDRGTNGIITIRAVINTLDSLTPLPQNFAQSMVVLSRRCAELLRGGTVSSLVQTGRDGVPAEPSGGLPGLMVGIVPEEPVRTQPEPGRALPREGERPEERPAEASKLALMLDCSKARLHQSASSRSR